MVRKDDDGLTVFDLFAKIKNLFVCDYNKIVKICNGEFDYGKPFFGQLMAGPQLIAYMIQVNYWMKLWT